jgi:integrase
MDAKSKKTKFGKEPIKWVAARKRWQVSFWRNGKNVRRFTLSRADALELWTNHCEREIELGRGQYSQENHREFLEAKRLARGTDLREVARFWAGLNPEGMESFSLEDARAEFLKRKNVSGLSASHLKTLSGHLKEFAGVFGARGVREVSRNEVLEWLLGLREGGASGRTVRNYFLSLSNFFNWCARRKFVKEAPTAGIEESDLPRVPRPPRGVLSVVQCAGLMRWLEKNRPRWVAWHAVQLFAGIRHEEVARMDWKCIDLKRKTITLEGWMVDAEGEARLQVKTGDDWVLHDLPENLWAWLKCYGKQEGPIQGPANKSLALIRTRLRTEAEPAIERWPHNAMRHTFCTMLMSLHGDAAKVANWSRHSNARVLYRCYVAKLVSREEAERFCEIGPEEAAAAGAA